MQSTSQTWRDLLASGAALEARATVGGVTYTDISAPVIRRAAMQNALSIGNVAAASLSLVIRGAGVVPRSAAVVVEARLNDGQTASEWLPQGTFYISRRARDPVTGLLALECYDALLKANALWVPSAGTWPRTMAAVAAELAALLGLSFDSRTMIPSGPAFVIAEPAAGTTVRDVLGMIAQAGGGNWIVTPGNRLRLLPVAIGTDTVSVTGVTGGMKTGTTSTVTGVRCSVDGLQTLIGTDTGIVVDATIPPVTAADMADNLIGQTYQPFSLAGAIYDPAAELGDGIQAGAGGEVASTLYSETATLGAAFRGDVEAPEAGELADEYPYIGSGQKVLALAKAAVAEAVGALDDSLTQQDIFNRLTANGAAQGLVLYNGQLYINASYIQSGTLVLGGANNQNGTLKVLNAAGQEIGTWTKDGIQISAGRIQLSQEALTSSVEVLLQESISEPFKVIYNDNTGEFITKLVGEYFSIENTDNGHRIRLSPEDLFLSDGSNVWFYVDFNNGSPYMNIYGDAFIEGDTQINGNLRMNSNLFGALGSTGFRITDESGALSYLCTADDFYGSGGGWNHFIICNHGNGATYYNYVLRLPFGGSPKYKRQTGSTSDQTPWYDFLTSEKTVSVLQGGTGATTAAGARNNLDIYTFHGNVNINSNGQGFISFSDFGLSSRPNVCFMEVINVGNTIVRYNYLASTSQIVVEPSWVNMNPITSTTVEMQGIAFA